MNVLIYVMFVILLIIIIDQVYSLTKFVYDYNSNYDYGRMMKDMCGINYTEYETHRFQLLNNIQDIRIKNDKYSNHMNFIVVIASFIAAVVISVKFAFVFNSKSKDYLEKNNFKELWDSFGSNGWKWKLFYVIELIMTIYIISIIPIFLIVILAKTSKDTPFKVYTNDNSNYNWNDLTKFNTSIFAIFGIIFVIMLISMLNNNNNNNNNNNSIFIRMSMFAAFVLAYFYLTVFVEKFLNTKDDKYIKEQYITELKKDETNDAYIGLKYLHGIFGRDAKDLDDYKSPLSIIGIFVVVCIVLLIIMFTGWINDDDMMTLINYVLLPYIFILFAVIVIIASKEYNTYVNKYLLYNPYINYTNFLENINNIFNQILENDKTNVTKHSICRNVVNAIHLCIYSDIFGSVSYDKLFVPALTYSSTCDDTEYIEYNKLAEYNIEGKDKIFFEDYNNPCQIENDILIAVMQEFAITTDKEKFKKKLKFCIINLLNNLTYDGRRVLKITNDFKYNNTIIEIDNIQKQLPTFTKKQEYLLDVIDYVADEYFMYKIDMYKETMQSIKEFCQCIDIQDITSVGYKEEDFKKKIADTLNDSNQTYSNNIKKDYIDKFMKRTKQLLISINDHMTTHISVHNKNYKLAQLIIKNYNLMQTDDFSKHKLLKLIQKIEKADEAKDYYDDIKDIKDSIDKLNDFATTYKSNKDENVKQKAKDEMEKESNNLKKYISEFLKKNITEPYYDKLIYDYQKEYITNYINYINNYFKENKITISGIQTSSDIQKTYDKIKADYETQYDNVRRIWKDTSEIPLDNDKNALDLAINTSSTIYILLIIYIVIIVCMFVLQKMQ